MGLLQARHQRERNATEDNQLPQLVSVMAHLQNTKLNRRMAGRLSKESVKRCIRFKRSLQITHPAVNYSDDFGLIIYQVILVR